MLKYFLLEDDKARIGSSLDYPLPKKGFLWLYVTDASMKEQEKLSKDFKLNPSIFRQYLKISHTTRFATKPFQFMLFDYFVENNNVKQTRMLFILEKNYLIMMIPKHTQYHDELFENITLSFRNGNGQPKTISTLLCKLLDEDTHENYDVLEKIEEKIIALEQRLLKTSEQYLVNVDEIISLKRMLFRMSRRFWASAKIIFAIRRGLTPLELDPFSARLFDDVYDTFNHQLEIISSQKEMLSDALDVYATTVSNQLATTSNSMNIVMKRLTGLTVIVMVPSLIAGIFGMNFAFIPESQEKYGFYSAIFLMMAAASFTYLFFHKQRWL